MAQVNAGRVRFVSRGEYNNSTQYYTLDLVNYDGSSYYAKENVVGVLPTDNTKWQLVAEKGSIGSTGATGPSGFSPTATVTQLQNGALISITDENGTTTANIQNGEVTNKEFDYYKTISNVLPKVEDEDTEMSLNNTGNAPLSIGLKGNTYQETTSISGGDEYDSPSPEHPQNIQVVSGNNSVKVENKNLCRSKTVSSETNRYSSVLWLKANLKPSTTYTISFNGTNGNSLYTNEKLFNYATLNITSSRASITVTTKETVSESDNVQYSANDGWLIFKNNAVQSSSNVFDNLMVEESSTATNYVEYQKQEYPINLGNIELCKIPNTTYEDDFRKSTGKNLLNILNATEAKNNVTGTIDNQQINITGANSGSSAYGLLSQTTNLPELEVGKTYTLSITNAFNSGYVQINYYNGSSQSRLVQLATGITSATFTVPDDYQYVAMFFIGINANATTVNSNFCVQLEEASQATYWEPYGKGKWIKYGAIGKVVLDGSETWNKQSDVNSYYHQQNDMLRVDDYKNIMLSNYYTVIRKHTTSGDYSISGYYGTNYPNQNWFYIRNIDFENATELKNWLSTHNTEVRYVLATPEITEITDSTLISQLNAIEYAMSYKDQANISQENNDMPFVISASAFKDLSNL